MTEAERLEDNERGKPNFPTALSRFVQLINGKELSQGDIADLRRLRPTDPSCMAFWRLVAVALEPNNVLSVNEDSRQKLEHRWAAAASALVRARGLHYERKQDGQDKRLGLGTALANGGYTELRFVRLLRATDNSLWDAARKAASYLASKGERFDHREMAELILREEGEATSAEGVDLGERLRRRIARDYFRKAPRE